MTSYMLLTTYLFLAWGLASGHLAFSQRCIRSVYVFSLSFKLHFGYFPGQNDVFVLC